MDDNPTFIESGKEINVSSFAAAPKSPGSGSRLKRSRWADIQAALKNKIFPNELYIDRSGDKGFIGTTYVVTWFMLPEGVIVGQSIDDLTRSIKRFGDLAGLGAIILTQNSGTDEFYMENLEFTSIVGMGPQSSSGVIATNVEMAIRSPFQYDLMDQILKASAALGITNQQDAPQFLLIEWRARDDVTSEVSDPPTTRCLPLKIVNMGQTIDESGTSYNVTAVRFTDHNFNSVTSSLQESITVEGETVGQILSGVIAEFNRFQTKSKNTTLVPDRFEIHLEAPIGSFELIQPEQVKYSSLKSGQSEHKNDKGESVVGGVNEHWIEGRPNATTIDKVASQVLLDKKEKTQQATFQAGTDLPTIIKNIIAGTKEFQAFISGLDDPQAMDAQQKQHDVDPADVERYFIKIHADTEILGYDPNRRQYAAKRIYKVHKQLNPKYSLAEKNTQQDKVTSADRLDNMLNFNLIRKAYHYFYTGLNTEIKNLEFSYDATWFVAKTLYSKLLDSYKREHGKNARKDVHHYGEDVDKRRDRHELEALAAFAKVEKITEKILDSGALVPAKALKAKKELEEAFEKAKKRDAEKLMAAAGFEAITETSTESDVVVNGVAFRKFTGGGTYLARKAEAYSGTLFVNDLDISAAQRASGVLFPVPYDDTRLSKTMQDGVRDEFDPGRSILAEIYQQATGPDMINLSITIRGDPWWIPGDVAENGENSISPNRRESYMVISASQGEQWDPNTGLMVIDERNSLNGVYQVLTVRNAFANGEFVQELECVRDTSIDLSLVFSNPKEYMAVEEARVLATVHT